MLIFVLATWLVKIILLCIHRGAAAVTRAECFDKRFFEKNNSRKYLREFEFRIKTHIRFERRFIFIRARHTHTCSSLLSILIYILLGIIGYIIRIIFSGHGSVVVGSHQARPLEGLRGRIPTRDLS